MNNFIKKTMSLILIFSLFVINGYSFAQENNTHKVVFNNKEFIISFEQTESGIYKTEVFDLQNNEKSTAVLDSKTNKLLINDKIDLKVSTESENNDYSLLLRSVGDLNQVCVPGSRKTERVTTQLGRVKVDEAIETLTEAAFLAGFSVLLSGIAPISVASRIISEALVSGSIYDLYMSYKRGEFNKTIEAEYIYRCEEFNFDEYGTKMTNWELEKVSVV